MLRYVLLLCALLFLFGCESSQNQVSQNTLLSTAFRADIATLSHARSYLKIGNIKKADERFQAIVNPDNVPGAILFLAELSADKGDIVSAQTAFLKALDQRSKETHGVPAELLTYFCNQNKWQALGHYAATLLDENISKDIINNHLNLIGLCFFWAEKWDESTFWLSKLDLNQSVDPITFLAMSRINIRNNNLRQARDFIQQFEDKKTQVDAKTLWLTIEVYRDLNHPNKATEAGSHLVALFPGTDYARISQQMMKLNSLKTISKTKEAIEKKNEHPQLAKFHVISKGETLYRLTKKYEVTLSQLLLWNPNLVINDIPLGTKIKLGSEPEVSH